MAVSLRASEQGLNKVEQARRRIGWTVTSARWCDEAKTSVATLKRFRRGIPIQEDVFKAICQAVSVNWEDVVDENFSTSEKPVKTAKNAWILKLNATFENLDESVIERIVAIVKETSLDTSLVLERVERGSVNLVFEGTLEGFERIQYLFQTGQLTEIEGMQIEQVKLSPLNLRTWLEEEFGKTLQQGWQTIESVFQTPELAFRGGMRGGKELAKLIELNSEEFGLVLDLKQENNVIDILVQLYQKERGKALPENVKLILFDEEGEEVDQAVSSSNMMGIQLNFEAEIGEKFSIKISYNESSVTEQFML